MSWGPVCSVSEKDQAISDNDVQKTTNRKEFY